MSKTVADKLSLGDDTPLILPATAHNTKFSDYLLKTLNPQSEITTDVSKLVADTRQLTGFRPLHKPLWGDVHAFKPKYPNQVCYLYTSCLFCCLATVNGQLFH